MAPFPPSSAEHSVDQQQGSGAGEYRVRLRVSLAGEFVKVPPGHNCFSMLLVQHACCTRAPRHCFHIQEGSSYRYHGGHNLLESLPVASKYADVATRLSKKAGAPVSIKYQLPCEDLDPDNLISVGDDEDLQEMVEEYERALHMPGTPVKTYRLRVFLFPLVKAGSTDHLITGGSRYAHRSQWSCFKTHKLHSRATSRVMTTEGKSSFGSNASSKSLDNLDADVRDAFSAGFEAGLAAHQLQVQHDLMDTETNTDVNTDPLPTPTRSVHMLHIDDSTCVDPRVPLDVHLPEHISAFGDALLSDAALLGLRNKLTPGMLMHCDMCGEARTHPTSQPPPSRSMCPSSRRRPRCWASTRHGRPPPASLRPPGPPGSPVPPTVACLAAPRRRVGPTGCPAARWRWCASSVRVRMVRCPKPSRPTLGRWQSNGSR